MGEQAVWQASLEEGTVLSPLNLRREGPVPGAGDAAAACWGAAGFTRVCSPGGSCRAELGCVKRPIPFRTPETSAGDGNAEHARRGDACVRARACRAGVRWCDAHGGIGRVVVLAVQADEAGDGDHRVAFCGALCLFCGCDGHPCGQQGPGNPGECRGP